MSKTQLVIFGPNLYYIETNSTKVKEMKCSKRGVPEGKLSSKRGNEYNFIQKLDMISMNRKRPISLYFQIPIVFLFFLDNVSVM